MERILSRRASEGIWCSRIDGGPWLLSFSTRANQASASMGGGVIFICVVCLCRFSIAVLVFQYSEAGELYKPHVLFNNSLKFQIRLNDNCSN